MDPEDVRILIVDDESAVRDSLKKWFENDGYEVDTACDAAVALKKIEASRFDLLLADIRMPGIDGMELHERLLKIDPSMIVIIMTAYATVETAVAAMKRGAFDYITKPFEPEGLSRLVASALSHRADGGEVDPHARREPEGYGEIIGESPRIREIVEMVKTVAATDITVLIQGESGTGKELIARAIHGNGPRRLHPFIPIPCGAPAETFEAELLGHEKGAFPGTPYRRKGLLEMARGGTAFFDDISSLSQKMQLDLLRIFETRRFCRIGSNDPIEVDFRIVGATNGDLRQAVAENRFREDLFYRINVFSIVLPPLRERRSDIPLLARHFLKRSAPLVGKELEDLTDEALEVLQAHTWPGNVRELENAIERAAVVAKSSSLQPGDLPVLADAGRRSPRDDSLEEVAREHIQKVLESNDWNITRAAKVLKIDRVTLYNKVRKFHIDRPIGR